jgi:hypothetical protein
MSELRFTVRLAYAHRLARELSLREKRPIAAILTNTLNGYAENPWLICPP